MGYYDDNIDWEKEVLRRYEEQDRIAEQRRLLSTGSMSDASEAFGHNPWALNAYLSRRAEGSRMASSYTSNRRRTVHDRDLLRRSYDEAHPPFPKNEFDTEDPLLFDDYEWERFGQVPPHTMEDAPPIYVMDEFDLVYLPVQGDTVQLREIVSYLYPVSEDGLPF